MKILCISAHYNSIDRRIISQLNAFIKMGHEVTLLTVPIKDDYSEILSDKVTIIPNIAPRNNKINFKKYIPSFIKNKIRFLFLNYYRNNLNKYFSNYFLFDTYNVIHAHDLSTLEAAFIIKNKISNNVKIIYDAHELYPHQFKSKFERKFWINIEKKLILHCDHIISVNEGLTNFLKKYYKLKKQPSVIYNTYHLNNVPSNDIDLKSRFGIKNNNPVFLFQGGLSPNRNIENIVMAFKECKNANLLIIGGGALLKKIIKMKHKYAIDNLFLKDWVKQSELPAYIKAVNFGIIPYLEYGLINNKYCTPNKLFEFIFFEKPMFTSNLPILQQIVNSYKIGKAYDLSSINNIARALNDFMNSNGNKKSTINFASAKQQFSWEKQERVLINIYKNIINS
jgi:glycosyl transferase family 4/glycosyl transferase family 1